MQQVCADVDRTSAWFYEPVSHHYIRILPDGEIGKVGNLKARLHGRDIPDPDKLWQRRCESASVTVADFKGAALKPSPVTYALFKHWQQMNHA